MNPIKSFIGKRNHKKCVKAFKRVEESLKYSTSHTTVMYLGTTRGYDELFETIKERGWYYELAGDNREGIWLTVKEV
jgi:hypothetical protein